MVQTKDRKRDNSILEHYGVVGEKEQGEIIYTPDLPEQAAFHVTKGFVRLVNSEQCTTKIVGPGDFFGDRSIFYSKNIYAEALSDMEYIRINEPNFNQLLDSEAGLAVEIITQLSKHHTYLTEKQNLLSLMKEMIEHLRKGHSLKLLLMNWKENKDGSMCWN